MRYVCLTVFTLISCCSALAEGQAASVSGEISSDSSVDFSAIHVELQDITSLGTAIERVDVGYDGRFEIRNVQSEQYNLTVMTSNETPIYRDVVSITSYDGRLLIKLPGRRTQQPVSGLVSFQQLSHKPPRAARKAFEDGVRRYEKHDIAGSLVSLQKAVALDPEYVQALNNLGARYMMIGRFDESASALQRAVDLDPHTAILHSNLAQSLILKGELAAAERAARRAVDLDRSDPRGAYMLGLSLILQEKYTPEAVSNLRRSDTFTPRARLALGLALANTGSVDAAREAFASCLKSPELPVRTEAERMLTRLSAR